MTDTSTEKYRLAAKELVYDTFMLSHQETEPQQGASQDSRLAALNAVCQREEELVANLQSSSNCLADNTRDAYRIIFEDYKKFCNDNYSSKTFKRYEVNPRKVLAYLQYLYAQRTPKHIGPTPAVRHIFLDQETVKANRVPIEGALETVDLARYVDAEEAAGRASCRADGGCTIYTPYSYSKIEHGYAALNTLQKLQQAWSTEPNTAQPLATYKLIEDSMKGYAKSLVGGILRPEHVERNEKGELTHSGRDVSTNSNATNYYTVAEHIRCLLYTWHQPINGRSIMIQEHFVLAV
ncbi:hypothetical protein BG006_003780 [Podila minutissima]|uniref:Uncharacterized protein n=1 Tax=Podila minutissima TaxID=64525 RepID=A0A9P5VGA1_9FUNG|nr:hypothetical protein BG006_003780 [Podila minutissima]